MNEIKQRFDRERERAPFLGDYIIFSRAIRGMKLTRAKVFHAFNKLVNKDDYVAREKEGLINWIIASVN